MPIPKLALPTAAAPVPSLAPAARAPAPPPPPAPDADEATILLGPDEEPLPATVSDALLFDDDATVVDSPPARKPTRGKDKDPTPPPARKQPARPKPAPPKEELVEVAALADEETEVAEVADLAEDAEVAELADEDARPRKPARRFGWVTVALALLGLLLLAAEGATPFLDGPSAHASGRFEASAAVKKTIQSLYFVPSGYELVAAVVPGALALIGLLGLLVAVVKRHFGFFTLLTTYLTALGSVAALVLPLVPLFDALNTFAVLKTQASGMSKQTGETIPLTTDIGLGPQLALGLAGASLLLLSLAALLMHRRMFSRFLYLLFIVAAAVGGGVFVLLSADIPPQVRGLIGS
jgi:hypothetical protein